MQHTPNSVPPGRPESESHQTTPAPGADRTNDVGSATLYVLPQSEPSDDVVKLGSANDMQSTHTRGYFTR